MKKLFAILLSLSMLLALCACGSGTAEPPAAKNEDDSFTAKDAAEETTDNNTDAEIGNFEERSFTITTAMNENEVGGMYLQKFADYVTEATGGAATFEIYWGGSLAAANEELDLCSSGSVDFIGFQHLEYGDSMPYIGLITQYGGTLEDAVDYFNYLAYENETSSAMIAEEAAKQNVIYLGGCQPSGANVLLSSKPFTGLDDFRSGSVVMGSPDGIWDLMGINHLSVIPPEVYESIQRGVCDAYEMSLSVTVMLQWYEVAKYYAFDGSQAVACPITCNLDTWNSLSEEYQQVMKDAQQAAQIFAYETVTGNQNDYIATLEDNGVTIVELSQEDLDEYASALFTSAVKAARTRAVNYGIEEDMETLIGIAADYLGLEIPDT